MLFGITGSFVYIKFDMCVLLFGACYIREVTWLVSVNDTHSGSRARAQEARATATATFPSHSQHAR